MARKKLAVKESKGINPIVLSDRDKKTELTVKRFLELHPKFIEAKQLEGLAPRTIKDHETHMKYLIEYINESKRSNADRYVDADFLRAYLNYMMHEKRLSSCTINIRLRTLKCYLKWLYDEGYSDFNYSLKMKLLKIPEDTIKPLSDDNVKKMLKAPDTSSYSGFRDFCLMIMMLDCGIRVSEACNIKISDVDLKAGLITVRAEVAKTRVARQLPISKKTCKLLKELISIAEDNSTEYVFQSAFGGQLKRDIVIQNFEKYGKKAGVKVRCTPHVWRHTFATNFIKAGNDVYTLQKILGHTTLEMCRRYVQLENTDLIKKHSQAKLLDKYLQ